MIISKKNTINDNIEIENKIVILIISTSNTITTFPLEKFIVIRL